MNLVSPTSIFDYPYYKTETSQTPHHLRCRVCCYTSSYLRPYYVYALFTKPDFFCSSCFMFFRSCFVLFLFCPFVYYLRIFFYSFILFCSPAAFYLPLFFLIPLFYSILLHVFSSLFQHWHPYCHS